MLIMETIMLAIGAGVGAVCTIFALFLVGLLYRLDSEHLCADEVDFKKQSMEEP